MSSQLPIGVFDSGLGGLSVAREIRKRLPEEDILYVADSAYCPYGGRPESEIRERSTSVVDSLLAMGAKVIVVACNTASGAAIDMLRERYSIPIVGLEPAVKPAAESTTVGRIAVLATPATLRTERFNRLVDRHAGGVELVKIPCPGFVEFVESGNLSGPEVRSAVAAALAPAIESGVDKVVLGCTHYPFLREAIAEVLNGKTHILDSGAAVARQLERVLDAAELRRQDHQGSFRLFTTGDPHLVQPVANLLWAEPVPVEKLTGREN